MKGGVAVQLVVRGGARPSRSRDLTWVFYDNEEVEAELNGLSRIARERPELLAGDFAVLWSRPTPRSRAAARAPCGWRST